jgi:hypothetical protein
MAADAAIPKIDRMRILLRLRRGRGGVDSISFITPSTIDRSPGHALPKRSRMFSSSSGDFMMAPPHLSGATVGFSNRAAALLGKPAVAPNPTR